MSRALMLAAPTSGAGKTTLTLAILRALRDRGLDLRGAKSGPDYIDPGFHAAATGHASVNLDAWAMAPGTLRHLAARSGTLTVIEGAMGVVDGAGLRGSGSSADLAEILGVPVIMILDATRQSHSLPLAVLGLRSARPDLRLAGVIVNRVASPRHRDMAVAALERADIPVLGTVPRDARLALPERHLGLVQAEETANLEAFLATAARLVAETVDLDALVSAATPLAPSACPHRLPPLGQRIAIARDAAFSFAYPHLMADWQAQGASLHPFSPLADEAPLAQADAIYLPGGYPELHGPTLARAGTFRDAMHKAASKDTLIYGECGGYMALGTSLTDADGTPHRMLGLLPVSTSFATRRLSLGYRNLSPLGGPWAAKLKAHEFHYATVTDDAPKARLFHATDADGTTLPAMGHRAGNISGSFAHVIAPA